MVNSWLVLHIVDSQVQRLLERQDRVTAGELMRATGLSRQAVHLQLAALCDRGALELVGRGRGAAYRRATPERSRALEVEGLVVEAAWRDLAGLAAFAELSTDLRELTRHVAIELMENAVDHSDAWQLKVTLAVATDSVEVTVDDDGAGLFARVAKLRGLASEQDAAVGLLSGGVTTLPERHRGEGLFFVDKMVDRLALASGELELLVDHARGDHALLVREARRGTRVVAHVARATTRTVSEVFATWSTDYRVDRTRLYVALAQTGLAFVSRAEARRLVAGVAEQRELVLDFAGVAGVGAAFVDELWGAWQRAHPEVRLTAIHANVAVRFMIDRAMTT